MERNKNVDWQAVAASGIEFAWTTSWGVSTARGGGNWSVREVAGS